jgi:hypothetical protein
MVDFNVADGVAVCGEVRVVFLGVDIRGDGAVREVRHGDFPFLYQPNC